MSETLEQRRKRKREEHKRWRKNHPERARELSKKASCKWRAANPERAKELAHNNFQKWYEKNRDRVRKKAQTYYKENREKLLAKSRANYRKNKTRHKEVSRQWRHAHPQKMRQYQREYKKRYPEKARDSYLKRKYGISQIAVETLAIKQDRLCKICRTVGGKFGLVVDHCHNTKMFRGLICEFCNSALGLFRDDPVRMRAAAKYIELSKEKLKGVA